MPSGTIINNLKLPDFVRSGGAELYAETYSRYMEAPIESFYFSYLTLLGSILSDRLTLKAETAPQPRFYTVITGESADDRKSTAGTATIKLFKDTFDGGFNLCKGIGSAEGLCKVLEKVEGGKLLLFVDELKSLISKTKIDGSVLLPCLTSLYEDNSYESHTKTSAIELNEAYLSILSCTTTDSFEEIWTSTLSNIGLDNRLLLVRGESERKFAIPQEIPNEKKFIIRRGLKEIVDHVGKFKKLDIEPSAYKIFEDWYLALERSQFSKRLDSLALRLMLILAVNDLKDIVDDETIYKTIEICNWQLKLRKSIMPIAADNITAKLENKIRQKLFENGDITERELRQAVNGDRAGLNYFFNAVSNLKKSNEIEDTPDKRFRIV
jgi:hypothetical protein